MSSSNIESSSIRDTAQEKERKNAPGAISPQYKAYIPNSQLGCLPPRDLRELILKTRVEKRGLELIIMKKREQEKESIALIQELVEEQRKLIEQINKKIENEKRKGLEESNQLKDGTKQRK